MLPTWLSDEACDIIWYHRYRDFGLCYPVQLIYLSVAESHSQATVRAQRAVTSQIRYPLACETMFFTRKKKKKEARRNRLRGR